MVLKTLLKLSFVIASILLSLGRSMSLKLRIPLSVPVPVKHSEHKQEDFFFSLHTFSAFPKTEYRFLLKIFKF